MMDYLTIAFSTTIIYFFIILSLRLLGKRQLAQLSTVDLVFILLLSNAVQNAMVNGNNTVMGGVVSAATLFIWNFILKYFLYRSEKLDSALQGQPVLLVYKGFLKTENLHKLRITVPELEEVVREHGVSSIEEVDLAVFEKDGNISVLAKSFQQQPTKKRKIHRFIKDSAV